MFDGRPVLTQLGSSAAITPEIAIAMKVTRGQRGGLLFTWPLVKSSNNRMSTSSLELHYDADSFSRSCCLYLMKSCSAISSVERTWHMLKLIGRSILHGQLIVLPCVTLEFNPEVPIRYP